MTNKSKFVSVRVRELGMADRIRRVRLPSPSKLQQLDMKLNYMLGTAVVMASTINLMVRSTNFQNACKDVFGFGPEPPAPVCHAESSRQLMRPIV